VFANFTTFPQNAIFVTEMANFRPYGFLTEEEFGIACARFGIVVAHNLLPTTAYK
jgi:hypothetical protein